MKYLDRLRSNKLRTEVFPKDPEVDVVILDALDWFRTYYDSLKEVNVFPQTSGVYYSPSRKYSSRLSIINKDTVVVFLYSVAVSESGYVFPHNFPHNLQAAHKVKISDLLL